MAGIQDIRIHTSLVYAAGACFIAVDSIMVALRIYARKSTGSRLGLDDLFCIIALLFVIGMCITDIVETSLKGFGYPSAIGDAGAGHADANVAGWPTELIQIPALASIKLSFLFLYRRVFNKGAAPRFQWLVWGMVAIVASWAITFFFLILFLCGSRPDAYWISSATEKAECLPTAPVHLSYTITDVITDILTIALPIPQVWRLHMTTRRKLGVTGVFGFGAITIAMSIIRLAIYQRALSVQFDPASDFEYITTLTSYFSTLELGLGLIAACLPVQYGLMQSEKVEQILRSLHSLTSLSSRGSDRDTGGNARFTAARYPRERLPPRSETIPSEYIATVTSQDEEDTGLSAVQNRIKIDNHIEIKTNRDKHEE